MSIATCSACAADLAPNGVPTASPADPGSPPPSASAPSRSSNRPTEALSSSDVQRLMDRQTTATHPIEQPVGTPRMRPADLLAGPPCRAERDRRPAPHRGGQTAQRSGAAAGGTRAITTESAGGIQCPPDPDNSGGARWPGVKCECVPTRRRWRRLGRVELRTRMRTLVTPDGAGPGRVAGPSGASAGSGQHPPRSDQPRTTPPTCAARSDCGPRGAGTAGGGARATLCCGALGILVGDGLSTTSKEP